MRIATLVVILLVHAMSPFAAAPPRYLPGIAKLQAETGADVLQDPETGRPYCVSGRLSDPVPEGQEFEAALRFFADNKSAYLMSDPAREIRAERIDTDQLGMSHVRMLQQYQGLPVYGGELIAHFSKDNVLTSINGTYLDGIKVDTNPQVSSGQAAQVALLDFESSYGTCELSQPELIVFPLAGKPHLAWRMELYSTSPIGHQEYFVDAHTGEVILKLDLIMNDDAVGSGIGVTGGTRTHIDTDYDGVQYRMIDNTRRIDNNPHGHNGQMPPGNTISTYVAGATLPGELAADGDNVWNDPSQGPAVDAHVYTALFYDWLLSTFGRNSFDNSGASMRVSVDYSGSYYNNAFWDGRQVAFTWTNDGVRSMAGCPDVVAHEWAHAVTSHTSRLVYSWQSGMLSEAFSDMMGAAFEFAHPEYDTPDWYIGENAYTDGEVIRDMSDPIGWGSVSLSPDYYDPYLDSRCYDTICTCSATSDYCYVHLLCGIGDKWFYLLSDGGTHHDVTVTGIGVENAIQIAYRANVFYWTPIVNYSKGAYGTVMAARDLDPSGVWETQVRQAWTAVGVHLPHPALVFSYPNGRPTRLVPGEPTTFEVQINPAYDGTVVPGSGAIYYKVSHGPRTRVEMTELAAGHYQATLPAVCCGQQIEFMVEATETTSGILYDPRGGAWYLAEPGIDQVVVFSDDFETDKGWLPEFSWGSPVEWQRGTPLGGGGEFGGPDPSSAYSGFNVWGYNLAGDYANNIKDIFESYDTGGYFLNSPPIDCSGLTNVHIDFQRWLGVEHPTWDDARIKVSTDSATWITVWENPDEITDREWTHMDLNISSVACGQPKVWVRFEMGPTDEGATYCGWNIDDFRVTGYDCDLVADIDADGVMDDVDNCPSVYNPVQEDSDGDLFGDACERCAGFSDAPDADGDGVPDGCDLCPGIFESVWDTDQDAVPDECDLCPGSDDRIDGDNDDVPDDCDNCVDMFNPGQEDGDEDGTGDVCCCQSPIGDNDGSGEVTLADVMHLLDYLFLSGPARPIGCPAEADFDQSGELTLSDLIFLTDYLYITGPSEELPECAP